MQTLATNTHEMGREEWLEYRRQGIGGSDAAVICGLNPFKSIVELYMEKRGEIEPGDAGEKAYWGRRLEDLLAEEWQQRTGVKLRRRNAILQHSQHPWMLANVDRVVVGRFEGWEGKTTDKRNRDLWIQDGQMVVPDMVQLQVQHYMAVTGYQYWWVAVLIGGNEYHYTPVQRDDGLISYMARLEKDFWRRVQEGDPPPFDGSDASTELLSRMYPDASTDTIDLPDVDDVLEAVDMVTRLKAQEHDVVEQRKAAENYLKAFLGEHEAGVVARDGTLYRVEWKPVTQKRLDTKALQKEQPSIYEQYAKESTHRRFGIKTQEVAVNG